MNKTILFLIVFSFVFTPVTIAATAKEKGRQIAEEADRRDLGWKDLRSASTMTLRNTQGQESKRSLRQNAYEINKKGQGDKSLIIFDSPKDIQGTALLSHTKILEADDQWLFLPSLKRVKRISSKNKSGPFVGSEFAYEDLLSQEVDKYDHTFLRTEKCGDWTCFVIERIPLYEDSGYTKQVVWIDQDEYRVTRVDFYDRKNSLLKTLTYQGYKKHKDKFWRPDKMVMKNHQNGKTTDLDFSNWEFSLGQTEAQFTPARLKRAR